MSKRTSLICKRSFTTFCSLILIIAAQAQENPIKIRVINPKKEPVPFATVIITNRADSLQSDKKAADSSGVVSFNLTKGIQYIIEVSAVNYLTQEKGITVTSGQKDFTFILESSAKTLSGVVVRSSKPLMRQEDDKTIVDPENLAATSTSGYEVIEKTPGLFVDQDGNIYISSTTPASILINGRELRMSTADIATMLKSLPPTAIQSIEIVRTPSAKYDASGSGGVVNVILKKGVKLGMTGSVNAGIQQGVYGNQFIGLNINNNDGKKSSYLNINYNRRNSYEQIVTDRLFAPDTLLSQFAFTKYPSDAYYGAYGITWQIGKKWEITYDANVTFNDFNNRSENSNDIKKMSSNQVLSGSLNRVINDGSSLMIGTGLESKLKIDSLGSEWTNDTWYGHTINRSNQAYTTGYNIPPVPGVSGDGDADNFRDYINIKSDLRLKMKKRFTFESGFQVSILNFRSETDYFSESGGIRSKDPGRTNTFKYNQNINALYVQGSKTFGKNVVVKFGTRLENTNMKGQQVIPDDTTFAIHRTDLFPYVYLSKKVIEIAGFELRAYLVYRRTITRPVYEQLNPFSRYVDQYLSETGNPSLRPQFTNNYEANISVNEMPILAVGVNQTKDIFTNVIYQADSSRSQAYLTYDNLGSNKEFYIRGLGAIPPGKKYFFVLGGQYNHNFYQGSYENKPLSFKRGSWTFFTYHSLKLDKLSQITLNGFVRLKGQLQFYELSSFGALNTSINRRFFKEKLTVTLSMNDIFRTLRYDFTINQGSIDASGYRLNDTRRFGINLRYSFGIRKKEESNNMFNVESPEQSN
ncbi:MAG: outer membrane beta-barrel protein [Chitinophagaceae bacterium]|nr:outer membrane beta-barrel protein [Chitinophagaceae bacterium]